MKIKYLQIVMTMILLSLLSSSCGERENTKGENTEKEAEVSTNNSKASFGHVDLPEWFKHSFFDVDEDIQEATDQGKRLIIYFHQEGCPYCAKLMDVNFGDENISAYAKQNFDILAINIFGSIQITDIDGEILSEKDYAKKMKVNFTPTMITFDENGTSVFRMNGYYAPDKFMAMLKYLAEKQENKVKFLDFLDYYLSQSLSQDNGITHIDSDINQPPFNLKELLESESKPLVVFFNEKSCSDCAELHNDILKREDTKKFLKNFILTQVDIDEDYEIVTPKGKRLTTKEWVVEKNIQFIPSILFFDESGSEVFRVDGYVKAFHLQSSLEYVLTGSYKKYPAFQSYIHERRQRLEAEGVKVEIME